MTKSRYLYDVQPVISIGGGIRPIADLVFQLTRCKRDSSYPNLPLFPEVEYSAALILLLVLLAESYLARVRHFDTTTKANSKRWATSYLATLKGCKRLANRFGEIYLLRNSIAHNHVFEYEHAWSLYENYRDRKFKIDTSWQGESTPTVYSKYVKLRSNAEPKTKLLGLRVIPTKMGREDVLKVFETVYQVLTQLHKTKHLDIAIDNLRVPYQPIGHDKKIMGFSFWNLIEEIRMVSK